MAGLLFKLGRWSFHRKWLVLVAWLVIFGAVVSAAGALSKPFSSQYRIGDAPSITANQLAIETFPDDGNPAAAATVNLVFATTDGSRLDEPANSAAVDAVIAAVDENLDGKMRNTTRFGNPLHVSPQLVETVYQASVAKGLPEGAAREDADNLKMVSDDATVAYTTFEFDVDHSMDVTDAQRAAVADAMETGRELGLQVEAGGAGYNDPIAIEGSSEAVGLAVAFVVLLFTFGSVIAAGLPVVTAVIGVSIGLMLIVVTAGFVELNNTTPTLAIMIGLAVGIDYALFILSRYRTERARMPADDAAGMAVGTAGSAVLFAGVTVVIALAALTVAGIEFLSWIGLLAAATVTVAMLVALTLLPALLGICGDKAFALRLPGVAGNRARGAFWPRHLRKASLGHRWVRLVHKAPALVLTLVVVALGCLAAPVTRLEMALPSDTTANVDTTQRKAADLMAQGFGAGVNAPLLFVVDAREVDPQSPALAPLVAAQRAGFEKTLADAAPPPAAPPAPAAAAPPAAAPQFDEARAARAASFVYTVGKIDAMSEVKNAQIISANEDGTAAKILVTPFTGPADPATTDVSHTLRDRADEIENSTGATIGMTGLTAVQMDITEALAAAMPPYLAVVVGLAIVLLLVIFRSVLVPVVAGLGFLLSVGAAFGVTVMFWQEGLWGLVSSPGPLLSFMPIFLIGVTFGLAMDYQVFLVTRMREYFVHDKGRVRSDTGLSAVERSTIDGFTAGARVVVAAALIMMAVFVAFIDQPLPFIQIFGFSLAAGVLFDAFFVRMALVPAAMFLMGRATWWFPRWLDRLLPRLDVEGAQLEEDYEAGRIGGVSHLERVRLRRAADGTEDAVRPWAATRRREQPKRQRKESKRRRKESRRQRKESKRRVR